MIGFIYFIEAIGGNAVKVGFTRHDPEQRIRELQTGNHCDLKLIGVIPGMRRLEGKIHRSAGPGDRLRGEWFTPCWTKQIIDEYSDEFIPANEFCWVDPSIGQFCETGAFVLADEFHIDELGAPDDIAR